MCVYAYTCTYCMFICTFLRCESSCILYVMWCIHLYVCMLLHTKHICTKFRLFPSNMHWGPSSFYKLINYIADTGFLFHPTASVLGNLLWIKTNVEAKLFIPTYIHPHTMLLRHSCWTNSGIFTLSICRQLALLLWSCLLNIFDKLLFN